jgi:hypothetical protein
METRWWRRGLRDLLGIGGVFLLFGGLTGCTSSPPQQTEQNPTAVSIITPSPSAVFIVTPSPSPAISAAAVSRIHGASPSYVPQFASVRFTSATTYAQAVAIIGGPPYPYSCDGVPQTPEPRPETTFATSHYLLISSQSWDRLLRLASSPQVVSIDGTPLYPCP